VIQTLFDQLLRPGAVRIEFQPIVFTRNGETELYALEALARGPRGTTLERADVLFEYARRKGEEARLDLTCIAEILASVSLLPFDPSISINVHGSTLSDVDHFAEKFLSAAASYEVNPKRLMLEIVEYRTAWTMERFRATLNTLREAGVRIAVDDLGVGASNFRMIVDCRPDHLKVDRYIVHGCANDRFRAAVLESIVTLSQACGASPIAEGVEDERDLALITGLGIKLIQGWLYAPSMPPADLARSPFLHPQPTRMKGFSR
jgi:EAL domain-containing protein (putative c-di-GMP-specific phosphodiesterase class I)